MKSQAKGAEGMDNVKKIFARVAFIQRAENGMVEILDGADDEETAGFLEFWEVRFGLAQVLDFYGGVVGDVGKFAVKFFD